MIAWIGWHADAELAGAVAGHLLLGRPRAAETEQRVAAAPAPSSSDAGVVQAQSIMLAHIDEPLTCREIARRIGLSLRQIERRFRAELGCSILQHYRQIRIAKAHQLLQQTDLSVTEVALSCGFSSPEYFCRLYRAYFSCSPSRDRRQSTTAPALRRHTPPAKAKRRRSVSS